MPDGSFPNLRPVLSHYSKVWTSTENRPIAGNGRESLLKSKLIRPFRSNQHKTDTVIAILEGLRDRGFPTDPAFANLWPKYYPASTLPRELDRWGIGQRSL